MPALVICAFRPKPGREKELLAVIRDHMPTLRSQGLVTDRAPIVGRATDGTILEVFEWKSQAAVDEAHRNPVVRQLWERFEECSQYISLRDLPETQSPFPHFEPVNLPAAPH
jgi:quinol monooxygenase YgiN